MYHPKAAERISIIVFLGLLPLIGIPLYLTGEFTLLRWIFAVIVFDASACVFLSLFAMLAGFALHWLSPVDGRFLIRLRVCFARVVFIVFGIVWLIQRVHQAAPGSTHRT